MCLTKVYDKIPKRKYGYKVYYKCKGYYYPSSFYGKGRYEMGKSYISPRKKIIKSNTGKSYVPLFHVFKHLRDAELYADGEDDVTIVKVAMDGIKHYGTQDGAYASQVPCFVARKIKLIKEVK